MPRKNRRRQTRPPTFFLDRNLGTESVPSALRKAGEHVEVHDDHFDHATEDTEWISKYGEKRWIALSRDAQIRTREIERRAVETAKICLFVLVSKNLTGKDMADAFVKALGRIKAAIKKHHPPFHEMYHLGSL